MEGRNVDRSLDYRARMTTSSIIEVPARAIEKGMITADGDTVKDVFTAAGGLVIVVEIANGSELIFFTSESLAVRAEGYEY